jgi:hypothetical protein
MNICKAGGRRASLSAGSALSVGERSSRELLMINPRLYEWKPKKGGPGQAPSRSSTRFRFLNEDRNGDHGHNIYDAYAGDGESASLAAAGPWRFDKDNQ